MISTILAKMKEAQYCKFTLKEGDAIVLMCPDALNDSEREALKECAQREFPGYRVVVLTDGLKLGVVSDDAVILPK